MQRSRGDSSSLSCIHGRGHFLFVLTLQADISGLTMVLGRFEQLVGAAGDIKELEYVAALHQTDVHGVRTDASIRGE